MHRMRLITLAWLIIAPWSSCFAGQLDDVVATYQRGDVETARRLLEPLAGQGMSEAQLSLGLLFIQGRGMNPDLIVAESWVSSAANQNFPPAEFTLGLMYQTRAALWGAPYPIHNQTLADYNLLNMQWYYSREPHHHGPLV
jgi:TPR repeat protein